MDFTDNIENIYFKNLLLPIKLIFPLSFGDISRTLGLGLIFIFTINFKKKKFNIFNCFVYNRCNFNSNISN